jgi:PAS domain S-box-containing protein
MIADDDRVFRDALADLISEQRNLELVGAAVDHADAIDLAVRTRPRVVILDARMPGGNATTTVRTIREQAAGVEVLVLSAYADAESAIDLLNAGAAGYLIKGVADEEILQAIARATRGQLSVSTALAVECVQSLRGQVEDGRRAQAATLHDVNVLTQLLDRVGFAVLLVARGGRIELANAPVQQLFGYRRTDLVGKHITAVVPQLQPDEPADESIGNLLDRQREEGGAPEARFTAVAQLKSGSRLPVEIAVSPLSLGLSGAVLFVRDISRSLAAESRYQQLFASFPDAIVMIDPRSTIQQVNTATEQMFGIPSADVVGRPLDVLLPGRPVIYRRDSDELPVRLGAESVGEGLELLGRRRDGTEFPVDISVGRVDTGEGRRVILSIRDATETVGARAALELNVDALRSTGQRYRDTIVELIRAQERERMRVAAGIHDDSLQVITAAALRLQQLRRRLSDPEDLKILSKLDETIQLAADRLRNMIFDFRPPALEENGLVAALSAYLDQVETDTGASYELEYEITGEPPEEARVAIYRIAQEALMNVRKHAHASRVRLRLSQVDDGYLTEIVDNGAGSDPLQRDDAGAGHLGLTLMRDRAEIVGGWFRIESTPGAGTTVSFWVPLGVPAAGEAE